MPERRNWLQISGRAVAGLTDAFAIVFRHLFRRPVTEEYPEYKRVLPARTRARIILTRDPDGEERCVACYLCAAACPVSCISMAVAASEVAVGLALIVYSQRRTGTLDADRYDLMKG